MRRLQDTESTMGLLQPWDIHLVRGLAFAFIDE